MAGLTLKHVYKVYSGRKTTTKNPIKLIINQVKKKKNKNATQPTVAKRSGNFVAVKDFNMEIEDGEFIVFVGPSGCGKSTTIRMIAGLEDISRGELYIDGRLVNDVAPKDRDIAMVFQNYALYPHMTAQKNIEFALKLRKIPVAKTDKEGNPILAIDRKKISELKEKIKAVDWEISQYGVAYGEMLSNRKAAFEKNLQDFIATIPEDKKAEDGTPVLETDLQRYNELTERVKLVDGDICSLKKEEHKKELVDLRQSLEGELADYIKNIPADKKTKSGVPALAGDKAKIKELKAKIKAVEKDISGLGEGHEQVLLNRKQALETELEEFLAALSEDMKDKNGDPVAETDKKRVSDLKAKLRTAEYDLTSYTDEEFRAPLAKRKQSLESDLKFYSETPVQAYSYKHMSKADIAAKVDWAAKILGIEELLDNKPAEMSGGQRQRVALGRAMVRGPKVFLLDEPLSNLDAKLRTSMRMEIVKLHKELKTTFIYVTHDQIEAMTMGTRIVVMKLGVVQQIDTPTNLYDFPENKFVAGFIGTPQMNFLDVTIKKAGGYLETTFANGQTVSFNLKNMRGIDAAYLDGEPHEVTLGIRGEHIYLSQGAAEKPKAKGKAAAAAVNTTLDTTLNVKEVLGNNTQLFVKLVEDGPDYIVCVPDRNDVASGDKITVSFKESSIHLFDNETELSIMNREIGND